MSGVRANQKCGRQTSTSSQTFAHEALSWFETKVRWDGLVEIELASGAPSWVRSLLVETRRDLGLLPDEWRFLFTYQALRGIAGSSKADRELAAEVFVGEVPDLYTLLQWLTSLPTLRVAYCDDVRVKPGASESLIERLAAGYQLERRQVFESIRVKLEAEAVSLPNARSG